MPTYLCHGFRWHRRDIRIFVVVHDLEDAAPDWIIGPTSSTLILDQFAESFDFLPKIPEATASDNNNNNGKKGANGSSSGNTQPNKPVHHDDDFDIPPSHVPASEDAVLYHDWSAVKLLEEYDPLETISPARPYAYVADHVIRIDTSADVMGEMAKYEKSAGSGGASWFTQLRDKVQQAEEIRWYIVVCGDELRDYPEDDSTIEEVSVEEADENAYNRRAATMTATSESAQESSFTTEERPSQDRLKTANMQNSQEWSHMRPPPIPADDAPTGDGKGHGRKPSLRHKLSRASGLRRLFAKKETQA